MKILFIKSSTTDYLEDSIYLGLKDKFKNDVEVIGGDTTYLYKNNTRPKQQMWGLGFSYSGILNNEYYSVANDVVEKIKNNYYDIVIYGFISRNDSFLDLVIETTNGKNVFLVNGEDLNYRFEHYNDKIKYFKRELIEKKENNIFPINYAIHPSKITTLNPNKTQEFSDSIPSLDYCTNISSSLYIFDNEKDYYENYQKSKYGITKKKGGWDSLRHYEIIANKCVPIFENIDDCPEYTLTNLPKKLLSKIEKNYKNFNENDYNDVLNEIFHFGKNNLTTDNLVNYILNFYE